MQKEKASKVQTPNPFDSSEDSGPEGILASSRYQTRSQALKTVGGRVEDDNISMIEGITDSFTETYQLDLTDMEKAFNVSLLLGFYINYFVHYNFYIKLLRLQLKS